MLCQLQEQHQGDCEKMRYREERYVAHEPPYLRDDGVPVERRAHRNALEDAGTPQHPHDANLRQDHGGKGEPRYGKTLAAY